MGERHIHNCHTHTHPTVLHRELSFKKIKIVTSVEVLLIVLTTLKLMAAQPQSEALWALQRRLERHT